MNEMSHPCRAETMAGEGNTRRYRDFAILLRNFKFGKQGSVSTSFQQALQRQRIPFKLTGGQSIYERKEVQDVMAYLGLILDGDNDVAFERVCNKPPRGMNPAKDQSRSMSVIRAVQGQMENRGEGRSLMAAAEEALKRGDLEGTRGASGKVHKFVEEIEELREFATWHSVAETIRAVLTRTGYGVWAEKQREKEKKTRRKKAGRKEGEEESSDSEDEEDELEGEIAERESEDMLSDEEGKGGEERVEEGEEIGPEEGGDAKDESRGGPAEEADAEKEERAMGGVLAGFVKEGEHFVEQWTAGVPPDGEDTTAEYAG